MTRSEGRAIESARLAEGGEHLQRTRLKARGKTLAKAEVYAPLPAPRPRQFIRAPSADAADFATPRQTGDAR